MSFKDKRRSLVVGIDASRNRSGGAKEHLKGLIQKGNPLIYGINEVHLWAYKSLADAIPDYPWLTKHSPNVLDKSLANQVWWQFHCLSREVRDIGCDILFNTDAGTVCTFTPSITLSQDMLSYEPGEMQRYYFSKDWLRLFALKYIQSKSLKKSSGAIFLTHHAKNTIEKTTGRLNNTIIIPHGIGIEFQSLSKEISHWPHQNKFRCLYVSNAAMYKHQWHVVDAIWQLRQKGINISLTLVGGGSGKARERLDRKVFQVDPRNKFIKQVESVDHESIPSYLYNADIFIFASSCENMPITLLEAMAVGLPIACSSRGPMPDILGNGGLYFDPEDSTSIANALLLMVNDKKLCQEMSQRAKRISQNYKWEDSANMTWKFIADTIKRVINFND